MSSPQNDSSFCAIGVDVGGTKTAAGLVHFPKGEVCARRQIPTGGARGGRVVFEDVRRLCEELAATAREQNQSVNAIGIGLCELIDVAGNVMSENCVAWKNVPVCAELSNLAPTTIEADVRAAARAEAIFGAGQDFDQFLYVTVGTGISCCLMLNGKPFMGTRGATGTMASSPLSVLCDHCGKVNQRTLEEIAAGPALVARYKQRRAAAADTGPAIAAAAIGGDADAANVVRSAGESLGAILGMLVGVLDPEAVIVGGGLGSSEGLYWESFVASTRKHIWWDGHRDLPILRAATGRDADLIGAAIAAWDRHKSK